MAMWTCSEKLAVSISYSQMRQGVWQDEEVVKLCPSVFWLPAMNPVVPLHACVSPRNTHAKWHEGY